MKFCSRQSEKNVGVTVGGITQWLRYLYYYHYY